MNQKLPPRVARTYTRGPAAVIVLLIVCSFVCCEGLLASALFQLPPHSGYHGAGADPRKPFFEGWYLRVTTQSQGSIALIFHVFDPHKKNQRPTERQGVGMQIITPSGSGFIESSDLSTFRAASHDLELRNYFSYSKDYFRVTKNRASGRMSSSSSLDGNSNSIAAEFDFDIFPLIGYGGDANARQFSTAGWLAAFPLFEPHYQILMSKGRAGGFLRVVDKNSGMEVLYDLDDATVYLEKNWGGSFPSKWWWVQANTFQNGLCVTAAGGLRRLPLFNQEEEVGFISLHWKGNFYPFPEVKWNVEWGRWKLEGCYGEYSVQLIGTCDEKTGLPVRCPTLSGMTNIAQETFGGTLNVKLFEKGVLLLNDTTLEACLEVGGIPWSCRTWTGVSNMKEPLKTVMHNTKLERAAADLLTLTSVFVEIPGL